MPQYQLAVGDIVQFEVKLTLRDRADEREFSATLEAVRISEDEWKDESQRLSAPEIITPRMRGWSAQNLVIDKATGEPAAYHPDAFAFALSKTKGLADVIALKFVSASSARAKN